MGYFRLFCLLAALLLVPVPVLAGDVVQGKCTAVDGEHNTITLREFDTNFDAPHRYGLETGSIMKFDVSKAKVGIPPEVGDILRVVYVMDKDTRKVLRLMNVSRQEGMNK